jgi:cell division protein FtsZ
MNRAVRVFGIGNAGLNVIETLMGQVLPPAAFVGINSDPSSLSRSSVPEKIQIESRQLPGLGFGGDPERGRAAAEEQVPRLKSLCEGQGLVILVTGLGGAAGTGITPVVARVAKETGALVICFGILPFECEGSLRIEFASAGLERLRESADLVICLSNQKTASMMSESLSLVETFKSSNRILGDSICGVLKALQMDCVMGLPFLELCKLDSQRSADCVYALVESQGPERSSEVLEKLVAHPMLDGAEGLRQSEALAVCVMGGTSLSMAEVNRIMDGINRTCDGVPAIMGACVTPDAGETLSLAVLACRSHRETPDVDPVDVRAAAQPGSRSEPLAGHLLKEESQPRPQSRFVPPAPDLPPEKMRQIVTRQVSTSKARRGSQKMRQGQLPLEIVSKGRFDKSEPTIVKGEDLDVPTYIRRGVSLN